MRRTTVRSAQLGVGTQPPLTFAGWLRYDAIRRAFARLEGIESVLEIGAGEGGLAARLARCYEYVGVEPDPSAFAKARARLATAGRGTILNTEAAGLPAARRFDLVCAFEVLEHIEDDAGALHDWRALLSPQGWIVLSVPADAHRYGAQDRRVGHVRRYDKDSLERLLAAAGFEEIAVERYGFPLGYLLDAARNGIAARSPMPTTRDEGTSASGRWLQPPSSLAWLTRVASAPFRLLQRPFGESSLGTGFVAVARAPSPLPPSIFSDESPG